MVLGLLKYSGCQLTTHSWQKQPVQLSLVQNRLRVAEINHSNSLFSENLENKIINRRLFKFSLVRLLRYCRTHVCVYIQRVSSVSVKIWLRMFIKAWFIKQNLKQSKYWCWKLSLCASIGIKIWWQRSFAWKQKRISFIIFARQRDMSWPVPWKAVSQPGMIVEKFYSRFKGRVANKEQKVHDVPL